MESQTTEQRTNGSHPEVSWDDLETPGFYVSCTTGNGYRVPARALIKGAPPIIEQVSAQAMTVEIDDGRSVRFDLKDYNRIDHGYAATIHKAQGMTVDRTHVLATPGMDAHGSYVALSRHRDGMELHHGRDDFANPDRLTRTLSRDRAKDMASDYEQREYFAPKIQSGAFCAISTRQMRRRRWMPRWRSRTELSALVWIHRKQDIRQANSNVYSTVPATRASFCRPMPAKKDHRATSGKRSTCSVSRESITVFARWKIRSWLQGWRGRKRR